MRAIVRTGSADREVRQAQESIIASVAPALRDLTATPEWTAPIMLNGWSPFDAYWSQPGFARDGLGRVYLRGTMKGGALGKACFVLPRGFRPGSHLQLATMSANGFGQVNVNTNGGVFPVVGVNTLFVLDGISFLAEG